MFQVCIVVFALATDANEDDVPVPLLFPDCDARDFVESDLEEPHR